jgi:hypothetical protein
MPDPTTPHWIVFRDGLRETWSRDSGPTASVTYQCAYEDRFALARELMGYYTIGSGITKLTNFIEPHRYPPSPNLVCLEIASIEGVGAKKNGEGSKWDPYIQARLVANYAVPPIAYGITDISPANQIDMSQPIIGCRQTIRGSAAMRLLPPGKLKFSTSGKVVEVDAGIPEGQSEIVLEFPRVPVLAHSLVKPYIGRVNTQAIFGHAAGQVLLDSVEWDHSASSDGTDCSARLTFLAKDSNWNALINDTGAYELVEYNSGGARPIPTANFWDLF